MLKQRHIHLVNEETGERKPIQGCKRKDYPKLCKADYPRTSWLVDKPLGNKKGRQVRFPPTADPRDNLCGGMPQRRGGPHAHLLVSRAEALVRKVRNAHSM